MAKAVQIRGVPDDVHRALRARAAAAGLSLSDYLLDEVTRLARRPPMADVLARAATRSGGVPPGAVAEALRAERDCRDRDGA